MNLANLKRTLKFDYLAFLAITRSFFKDKNFLKYFGFIYGLYFLALFKLFIVNIYYIDDLGRAMNGYIGHKFANRWGSEYLSNLIHMDYVNFITDISPLTQLIAIVFLSIASMALVKIVNKKITYWGLVASLVVGLSPWYLQNISYKFDSPYMALATTCAILPFLFVKRLSLFFIASVLFLLCMWNTYQANNGIYIVLSMFIVLNLILQKANLKQILKFIFVSVLAFGVALAIYKFLIITPPPPDSYIASVDKIDISKFFINIDKFLNLIKSDIGEHIIKFLFYIVVVLFFIINLLKRKVNFIVALISLALFFGIGIFVNYGLYLALERPILASRAICGFGVFTGIMLVSLTKYRLKFANFFTKFIVLIFAYNLIVISNSYANALVSQQKYSDFRVEKMFNKLDDLISNLHKPRLYVKPIIINSRQLRNTEQYLPLLNRLVFQKLRGEYMWNSTSYYLFFDYKFTLKSCKPENTKPVKIDENKFNIFEIYNNDCIEISYKDSTEQKIIKLNHINNFVIKNSVPILKNHKLQKNLNFSLYNYENRVIIDNINTLIFEFDKKIPEIANKNDTTLGIHLFIKNKDKIIVDKDINEFKKISGKYYYIVGLANANIKDIEKIQISFWNKNENITSAKFDIDMIKQRRIMINENLQTFANLLKDINLGDGLELSIYKENLPYGERKIFEQPVKNRLSFYKNPLILEFNRKVFKDSNLEISINNGDFIQNYDYVEIDKKFYYIFESNSNADLDLVDSIYFPQFEKTIRLKEQIALENYLKSPKTLIENKALKDDLKLSVLMGDSEIFEKENLIFEFDKNIKEVAEKSETVLYIHLFVKNTKKYLYADKNINHFVQIGNKFYYTVDLKNQNLSDIEKITFGFWDKEAKKSSARFLLNPEELNKK